MNLVQTASNAFEWVEFFSQKSALSIVFRYLNYIKLSFELVKMKSISFSMWNDFQRDALLADFYIQKLFIWTRLKCSLSKYNSLFSNFMTTKHGSNEFFYWWPNER